MLSLRACAGRPEAGAKAQRLGQALGLGLPVPDGVVLLPEEPVDAAALAEALVRLGGGPFVVRSSAAAEDRRGQSAAGLFLSLCAVPAGEVAAAAAQVRASGTAPLVRACLGGPVPVAVLIQPHLPAARLGVMHLPPAGPALAEERAPEAPEWGESEGRPLDEVADAELLAGARRLAALLDEGGGLGGAPGPARPASTVPPAQIEYARLAGGELRFLEVRPAPVPPAAAAVPWPAPDGVHRYELDREHNPDPLSPAQAGLVDLVDEIARPLGLTQRLVNGYLYVARTGPGPPVPPLAERGRLLGEVIPACEALLRSLEALPAPTLPAALSAYREIFRRYLAEIRPTLRAARGDLDRLLREHLGEPLDQHPALLAGTGGATQRRVQALWAIGQEPDAARRDRLLHDYLQEHGAAAPAWDVAVPCDDEAAERLLSQAVVLGAGPAPDARRDRAQEHHLSALAGLRARLPPAARGAFAALLAPARAAAALAEDDDVLFFRAQRLVRRALRARGAALVAAGVLDEAAQVFYVPLPLLQLAPPPADLRARAVVAQRQHASRGRLFAPDRFEGGRPQWPLPGGPLLRGRGVAAPGAAPVRGRARVLGALAEPPPPAGLAGAVLVLPALLPSWAPQLLAAAALVTDSGGALSHGATLAQEAGVPAVVGTRHATRQLRDGDEVVVDAARGLVVRLSGD